MMSNLLTGSERARLDPFVALADDGISMRDQRDLMSQPFFSLAKGRRTAPILYEAGGVRVEVHGFPEHGMAPVFLITAEAISELKLVTSPLVISSRRFRSASIIAVLSIRRTQNSISEPRSSLSEIVIRFSATDAM